MPREVFFRDVNLNSSSNGKQGSTANGLDFTKHVGRDFEKDPTPSYSETD